jgi:hypothetical protein
MGLFKFLLAQGLLFAVVVHASPEADARYAFKNVFATVINTEPENVHAQYVQSEVEKYFATRPRFTLIPRAAEIFREVKDAPPLGELATAKPEDVNAYALAARAAGADALVLLQVKRQGEEYSIAAVSIVPEPTEILFQQVVPVKDRFSLASFGAATVEVLSGVQQSLPFDASIIQREGYRVVIDRGAPSFQQGSRVAAFTLEPGATGLGLRESGVILINRVDRNLSFGTILVENKPLEVLKGNKVRYQNLGNMGVSALVASRPSSPVFSRDVASRPEASSTAETVAETPLERWAQVDVQFVAGIVTWNRTAADSGAFNSDTGFYPGAAVRGEIKLTKDFFAEAGGVFAFSSMGTMATGTTTGVSSQYNQIRLLGGYRLTLNTSGVGPSFLLRAGLSRTQYQVDELPSMLASSSAAFTGVLVGGGIAFPFSDNLNAGLEMNALLFPSLAEPGGTSGETASNVSGFDFSVKGVYRYSEKMSFDARLVFQTHSSTFNGAGSRAVPLASLSQSTRLFQAGIQYVF